MSRKPVSVRMSPCSTAGGCSLRAAWPVVFLVALAGCASSGANRAPAAAPDEPSGPPVALERPPVLVVEAIVTDKKGTPVTTLRVSDFQVSVDGRRRPGAAVARLYRGPGAAALAASVTSTAPGETQPVAEPSRTIVLVIDQPSFGPGDEARARTIVEACLATVGVADQVAVVSLPLRRGATIAFERAAIRQDARRAEAAQGRRRRGAGDGGRRPRAGRRRRQAARGRRRSPARPRQEARAVENPPNEETPRPEAAAGEVSSAVLKAHAVSSLGGLSAVLRSLAESPGAKNDPLRLRGTRHRERGASRPPRCWTTPPARRRGSSRCRCPRPAGSYRDAGERDLRDLAQDTGGALVPLSSKPEAALERLAGQLSFSYLLMLAPMPGDTDPGPHALAVTLPRRSDLVVQAPRRVTSGRVTADAIVASLSPQAAAAAATLPPPVGERPAAPPQSRPGHRAAAPPRSPTTRRSTRSSRASPTTCSVYGDELSSIVSEETYTQEATAPRLPTGQDRRPRRPRPRAAPAPAARPPGRSSPTTSR